MIWPRQSAVCASTQISTPVYACHTPMLEYTFIVSEFNELNNTVVEASGNSGDRIQIVDGWKMGYLSGNKTLGFLGSGSSKVVIYVHFIFML